MRSLVLLLTVLAIAGCSDGRKVGEGAFQKRKYQRGWHVDLRGMRPSDPAPRVAQARTIPQTGDDDVIPSQAEMEVASIAQAPVVRSVERPPDPQPGTQATVLPATAPAPSPILPQEDLGGGPLRLREAFGEARPEGPFNPIGVVALLLVATGIALAFLTNSGALVAAVIVAGIVLAAIGLRRIRSQEQRGKGYALVALIIGLVGALLTAMVIIRSGW